MIQHLKKVFKPTTRNVNLYAVYKKGRDRVAISVKYNCQGHVVSTLKLSPVQLGPSKPDRCHSK
jgi:hypothetical protein